MKKLTAPRFAILLALLAVGGTALSADRADQLVNLEIDAVNELAVTGSPTLIVNEAVAGGGLAEAVDSSTTYAVTTNQSNMKITANLDASLPAGLTLKVSLAAPSGATSSGPVTLTTSAADVVTGISQVSENGLTITYTLSATLAAGTPSACRTVTFTLTSGG